MRRKASLLLLLGAIAACGMAACGDDDPAPGKPTPGTDGGSDSPVTPGTDGGPIPGTDGGSDTGTDAPPGPQLFTDYVKDLITNQTANNNLPDDWTTKTFAPDPEDPAAFPPSFFP